MLKIIEIHTTDVDFRYMKRLLIYSFPSCEYRDIDQYNHVCRNKKAFRCNIIYKKNTPIGLINFWEFKDFIFLEHFAIDPLFRNLGYGKRVLEMVQQDFKKPFVLEVEQPTCELAKRRIQFYQRAGLKIYSKTYNQPPYRKGEKEIPMYLMGTEELFKNQKTARIKETLYTEVYSY